MFDVIYDNMYKIFLILGFGFAGILLVWVIKSVQEIMLNHKERIESDIQLTKSFIEIIRSAYGLLELKDEEITDDFITHQVPKLKSRDSVRKVAQVSQEVEHSFVANADQIAAIVAIYELAAKHLVLRKMGLNALRNLQTLKIEVVPGEKLPIGKYIKRLTHLSDLVSNLMRRIKEGK